MPRMDFFRDSLQWKCGFSLSAHEKIIKFYAPTKDDSLKWYTQLGRLSQVALMHISRDYIMGKVISKANCMKVHSASSVNGDGNFIVKSFFKKRLFESEQAIVFFISIIDEPR